MNEIKFATGMVNVLLSSALYQLRHNNEESADILFGLAIRIAMPYPELRQVMIRASKETGWYERCRKEFGL